MKYIILILCTLLLVNCSDNDDNDFCLYIDKRQCDRDPWADQVDNNASANVQADQLKQYLESQGINVTDIKIDLNFHEVVCEACFVCPVGPRIFLKTDEVGTSLIEALDPLNMTIFACSEF